MNGENENSQNDQETEQHGHGIKAAAVYLANNKRECVMCLTRMSTMLFTLSFIFPITTGNQYSYYYKALMSNAVTNIIRLNQRLPPLEFSKAYLGLLLLEDSCHYILYSLIFMYTYPFALILLPVFCFAYLHSTTFTSRVFEISGLRSGIIAGSLSWLALKHSKKILRLVAYTEIFLMPFNVLMILIGRGSLLTPVIYYRFLTLRYQSRRNPYTRSVFTDLRIMVEILADQPAVPQKLRWLCFKLVELVSRLAPPITPAAAAT